MCLRVPGFRGVGGITDVLHEEGSLSIILHKIKVKFINFIFSVSVLSHLITILKK